MQKDDIQMQLKDEYFNWIHHKVCGNARINKNTYNKLLRYLDEIDFIVVHPMDDNRRVDGIDFRYQFGYYNGYSEDYIRENLDLKECSVLEMMVALAFRGEEQFMSNTRYGDRTGQWFWEMIVSLGLGSMNDKAFDRRYVSDVIDNFLNRRYKPNGEGGLFTLNEYPKDLREVEIWYQFLWHLNEVEGDDYE